VKNIDRQGTEQFLNDSQRDIHTFNLTE